MVLLFFSYTRPVNAWCWWGLGSDCVLSKERSTTQSWETASTFMPLLGSGVATAVPEGTGGPEDKDDITVTLSTVQDSALVAARNPAGNFSSPFQDQIVAYTIQPGDTPGSIAKKFGISLNTLLWANNLSNPSVVKTGDELIILPVSGVKYEIKKGDTIDSIAKKFKGDPHDILSFNGLAVGEVLRPGDTIIVPDGEVAPLFPIVSRQSGSVSLPEIVGYYLRPLFGGRKSRGLHGFNGVDLAISCGSPVLASAEGIVLVARSSGWNGGYGKYIVLTHPNGTQTLYSHLGSVLSTVGQKVAQASQIGRVGSTGNSTGCHVHFEVRGAKNPF